MGTGSAPLTLTVADSGTELVLHPGRLVVAGYTGRDEASVRAHIEELAEIGVPPPPSVPMFYHLDTCLLTAEPTVGVTSTATSGEIEPVLLRHSGTWYLGIGSDHTDRRLEREDVGKSKAACPKPLGRDVVRLPEGSEQGAFDALWDRVQASCRVDGDAYQEGSLDQLRAPSDLLPRLAGELRGVAGEGSDDLVMYAGTLPLLDGEFRPGRAWSLTLTVPLAEGTTTLSHSYEVA